MKISMIKLTQIIIILFLSISFCHAQTDITNSSGTISAQYTDSPSGEDITKVTDNQSSTKYLTFHASGWIQFRASASYVVTRYSITSANDAPERDPLNWTFQGSTNGSTWVTLNTQSNQDFPSRLQRREFSFTNSTAYSYYRLQMSNNSGTILQLAEWEIFGTATGGGGVATLYQHCSFGGYAVALPLGTYTLAQLQSRGVVNNDVSSIRVNSGYKVTLYDTDNFTGASIVKTSEDNCLVDDSFNDRATSVKVETNTGGDDWANFQYPSIQFEDRSPSHPGSTIFHNAIPDPVADMRAQILQVVKKLHYNANDNIRTFSILHFIIEDYAGVAEKWGSPPEIFIRVSTRHIQNVYNNAGGNNAAVRTEILGILSHEGTHGYQYEPRNAGAYTPGTDFYGFIEGLADYVRISVGLHPGRTPSPGGTWRDGYTTSGFFINWMVNAKDPNFAIKFQHTARTYTTWSWNAACTEILGVGVQTLWNEYQASLSSQSALARSASSPQEYQLICNHEVDEKVQVKKDHISLYPNPVATELRVLLEKRETRSVVDITNFNGAVVKSSVINGDGVIDVRGIPEGWYIITVKDQRGEIRKEKLYIRK
jgi:hypothetical protein